MTTATRYRTAQGLTPAEERLQQAVTAVADGHWCDNKYVIVDYVPDSAEYDGETEPGSPWDEECDARLAAIRRVLPRGWQAEWVDDDLHITRRRR